MTERVWVQPCHLIVREGHLRAILGIPDTDPLPTDPDETLKLVGDALMRSDLAFVLDADEDWHEAEREPIEPSGRCGCGHWLQSLRDGHPEARYGGGPCQVCGCTDPHPEPLPPWAGIL